MKFTLSKDYYVLLLIIVIVSVISSNIYYIVVDREPQAWDQALHMTYSYIYFKLITSLRFGDIIHVSNYYPPLLHLSSIPLYIFGFSEDIAIATNIIYYFILIFSVYNIGRHFWGREAGIIATILVSLYPALIRLQREYLIDFALSSIVVLSVYLFVKSQNFRNLKYSILFGISFGFAELLKWNAFIFILPAVAVLLYLEIFPKNVCAYCGKPVGDDAYTTGKLKFCSKKHAKIYDVQSKRGDSISLNALTAFFVAFITTAWWYLPNLNIVLTRLSYFASMGGKEGDPTVYTVEGWLFYLTKMDINMGALYFVLFVVSLIWVLRKRPIEKPVQMLLFAIVLPYLILTAVSNKDGRYIVPILPFAALITSRMLLDIKKKDIIMAVLVAFGFIQILTMTFGYPDIGNSYVYPAPDKPKTGDWKIHDLLETIASNSRGGEVVVVLPDHPYLNGQSLEFYRIIGGYNFKIYNGVYLPFEAVAKNIDKIGFIVLIEPREHRGVYGEVEEKLYDLFYSRENEFTLTKSFDLPDGSKLLLYKNKHT